MKTHKSSWLNVGDTRRALALCAVSAGIMLLSGTARAGTAGILAGHANISPQRQQQNQEQQQQEQQKKPANPDRVVAAIRNVTNGPLEYFFNALKFDYLYRTLTLEQIPQAWPDKASRDSFRTALKANGRYFAQPTGDTVFEVLPRIHWDIRMNAPCVDHNGADSDGSADRSTTIVCISVPRLSAHLAEDELEAGIMGLAVHEVSHLFKTDEDEAKAIQATAERAARTYSLHPTSDRFFQMIELSKGWLAKLQKSLKAGASFAQVCKEIQDPVGTFQLGAQGFLQSTGGLFMPIRAEDLLAAVTVAFAFESAISGTFCYPNQMKTVRAIFNGRKEMRLAEFLHGIFGGESLMAPPNVVDRDALIKYVKYGDKDALISQLALLESQLPNLAPTVK